MKNVHTVKSQAGFSLVELMVVVAIIGILATLAMPAISKYMAKARQSEAKTQLSALYTSEKAFYAEYTSYDSRFGAVGFSPEGQLRYNVGFGAAGVQAGLGNGYSFPPNANVSIATLAYCGVAGAMVNNCSTLNGATNAQPGAVPAAAVTINGGFTAGANAIIYSTAAGAGTPDLWTMDQNKVLLNTQAGIL